MRNAEAGKDQIGKREEITFTAQAQQQKSDDASEKTAVKDHARGDQRPDTFPGRILNHRNEIFRGHDPVKNFHPDKTGKNRPDYTVKNFIIPVEIGKFPGEITGNQSENRTDQNTKAHGWDAE